MCIDLKRNEKLTATEDIDVLKVVRIRDGKICSPMFQYEIWIPGEIKEVPELEIVRDPFAFSDEDPYRTMAGLYSFSSKCNPQECKYKTGLVDVILEVWKAKIPKESDYVQVGNQLCSNRLILISKVC